LVAELNPTEVELPLQRRTRANTEREEGVRADPGKNGERARASRETQAKVYYYWEA
jgi:hypothetical protein